MSILPISSREKVDFIKNFSVMLKSGMAINESLLILGASARSRRFQDVVGCVHARIEQGTTLSDSFKKEKKIFGPVATALIDAGEKSGTLDENLSFLSDWMERNEDLRSEVKAATLYPKLVLFATALLGGGLSVYILPKLVPLFTGLHVELPFATKMLLSLALFSSEYWHFSLLAIIAVIFGLWMLVKIPPVRKIFHRVYLKTPFLGRLLIDYELALICQLFATLFRSGLLMNESLEIISESAANMAYQGSLKHIQSRVNQGETLSVAMKKYPALYPRNLIAIVETGERSGTIEQSFAYLSEFYLKSVKIKTKKLPTVLEPALLLFIAVFVGFIAIAIIMPVYQLTGGLSR